MKSSSGFFSFVLLLVLVFTTAVAGAYFATQTIFDRPISPKEVKFEPMYQPMDSDDEEDQTEIMTLHDKTTVLIMGVDEREDDVGRSDTMMVAMLDPDSNRVSLISIPRDTRVRIRNRGYDKINAAYAYGGVSLAENTVENLIGVDIDHYFIVNTKNFSRIIDAIGGVDINVKDYMYYEDPWDDDGGLYIDFEPGLQHMDGKTAITYVRYRDSEGDIGRIERQQDFMRACMSKFMSPMIIPKLPGIIAEVTKSVKTDLSINELLAFAGTIHSAGGLETAMAPGTPLYIDEISYWIPDVEYLRDIVYEAAGLIVDPYIRRQFAISSEKYNGDLSNASDRSNERSNENIVAEVETTPRYTPRENSIEIPAPRVNSRAEAKSESRSESRSERRNSRRQEVVEERVESIREPIPETVYESIPEPRVEYVEEIPSREVEVPSRSYEERFPTAEEIENVEPIYDVPTRGGGGKTR